jgi:hypothetical protein
VRGEERETDRLHSAHAIAPCERFHSRSLCLPAFAVSLRPEGGMGVKHSLGAKQWTPGKAGGEGEVGMWNESSENENVK